MLVVFDLLHDLIAKKLKNQIVKYSKNFSVFWFWSFSWSNKNTHFTHNFGANYKKKNKRFFQS